jgi:hypothetical protein
VDTKNFQVMMVSLPSLPDYLALGDTLYIDCCVDTDCRKRVCMTPSGCIEGACMYDIIEGAPCALEGGATGYCDAEANCIGTVSAPPVETAPVETVPVETAPVEMVPVEMVPVDAIPLAPDDGTVIE